MYYWLAVCGFSPHLDSVRGFEPFLNSVCGFLPFQNSACSFWPFSTAICGFPCGNIRCDILGLTQLHQKHHSKKSPNKSPCPSPPIYIVAYNVCTVRFAEIIEIKNEIAPQFPISTHPFVLFCFVSWPQTPAWNTLCSANPLCSLECPVMWTLSPYSVFSIGQQRVWSLVTMRSPRRKRKKKSEKTGKVSLIYFRPDSLEITSYFY